jgi:hypothetical protein
MAYGAEIRNEFGELVTDFQESLEIVSSGTTSTSASIGVTIQSNGVWGYSGPVTQELFTFADSSTSYRDAHPHFIGVDSRQIQGGQFAIFSRVPVPLSNKEATFFYQVGSTGLLHHSEHMIDNPFFVNATPSTGLVAMSLPTNNTPLPYIKVEPYTPKPFPEGYGMQLRDESNSLVFDSRADFLSISEVRFVPKATIANILFNNAVVDLTLRTPVPDCYISAPNHASFFVDSGASTRYRFVKIEQTSPTNIRLSRVFHGPSIFLTSFQGTENDTVIIVARNPFA